ncbi:MAG: response regulator [Lachnospiraceae bacterium]|nr:response regulator [Lachnospiraceae bacterium]
MRIAVVDPDKKALHNEIKCVKAVFSDCETVMFVEPGAAQKYLEDNAVDVLITQVPMLHMSGIQLGRRMREVQPGARLVYMADDDAYCRQAMEEKTDGYLVKPVTIEKIRQILPFSEF